MPDRGRGEARVPPADDDDDDTDDTDDDGAKWGIFPCVTQSTKCCGGASWARAFRNSQANSKMK
jgi:hypothetical protein